LNYPKKIIDEILNKLIAKKQIKGTEGFKPGFYLK